MNTFFNNYFNLLAVHAVFVDVGCIITTPCGGMW